MLQRLLQVCLVAIATLFLVGEVSACPHHVAAPPEVSDDRVDDAPAGRTAEGVKAPHLATPEGPALRESAQAHPHISTAQLLRTVTASWAVADVGPGGDHGCCGTLSCAHAGVCSSGCCAAAPSFLAAGGRLQEQKLTVHVPHRPDIAMIALPTAPSPTDGDEDRRRWRDAEAVRQTLHQARLARVARLTI